MLILWARDLSTCTADEIRERWKSAERRAINKLDDQGFEGRLKDHSFLYFLAQQVFFDNVKDRPEFLYAPFHREIICKEVEDYIVADKIEDSGLLLLAQRDSFKSTFQHGVTPLGVTLRDYHLHKRHARVGLIHQKEDLSTANLIRLKSKAHHPWIKKVWPEFYSPTDFGTKMQFRWVIVPVGEFSEPSVKSAGLGADLTGFHLDWLFCSDLVIKEQRYSKQLRDDAANKFFAMRYLLDSRYGKLMVDGTLYHPNDLHSRMIRAVHDGRPVYKVVKIAAGGSHVKKPLTLPHRHSDQFLESLRTEEIAASGSDELWWLQMQNQLKSQRDVVTNVEYLKHCKHEHVPDNAFRVIIIDPAWKGTHNWGTGDEAAIEVWAIARVGVMLRCYLIDGVISRELSAKNGVGEVIRLMKKYGVMDVAPEEHGGFALSTDIESECATHGIPVNIIRLKTVRNKKDDRIVNFTKRVESGQVYVCEECDSELKDRFTDQYRDFGQLDFDDALDCASYIADPAIVENCSPAFNVEASRAAHVLRRKARRGRDYRTKYCMN